MSEVRFLADAMLGRLARWLRFLGYDVLYLKDTEDSKLVRLARAQQRVLLTRDRGIPQRYKVPCVLVESELLQEQIKQITGIYPPQERLIGTRCLLCNGLLIEVTRQEARDRVPEYVLHNHKRFYRCPDCDKLYWEGTHMKNLQKSVDEILQEYL